MPRAVAVLALLFAATLSAADAPPMPAAERAKMLAGFSADVAALDLAIVESPREAAFYSRRGDRHLFLAHFPEAVADFEKMIALDPAHDAPHWRLGIAYYFAGQFAKSSRQFEKYHAHDGGDRENGLWKFLADVKILGLAPAQRAMLAYASFDREPFPSLYEMFAGRMTTDDFLATLKTRRLAENSAVMFFAQYYAGLHDEILGHRERALGLLRAAVARPWGRTAEGGPAYMWQVARLHYEKLAAPQP